MLMRLIPILAFLVMQASHVTAESRNNLINAITVVDANVVFMRHTLAPGYGDPDNFSLSDCDTQRNLDAKGRQQASDIGAAILHSGFRFTQVFSSEWCRCKETTELMKLGKWRIFPGLNSFFQGHADRQDTLEMLSLKLEALTKGVTLMVTHQVIINAVTGASVGSGEFVAYNTDTKRRKVFRLD
ncbi:hypothetical protein IMCC1933_03450 [Rhodobacteraceae bacterium IMCC1933]|nr:hypothetical protein [Rhodobacteraceae bacterium IMCC1923]MDP4066810.1 hypothetical protein [Rhodobacteraceae bacterium IMCC1933]MDP4072124.1 hypothetical protein [Rhodobacteraceae bacterium IMCC1909]